MLISGGALQSDHCRQTAAAAARFGFECKLALTGNKSQRASGNLLFDQLFGAEIVYVADRKDRDSILQEHSIEPRTSERSLIWSRTADRMRPARLDMRLQ
jgi:1-aminocyclopropane-1-carboxylate deaminase/D-cysteine desulfhydrase-like pyridoxal-dependent ACC family enzyme